MLTTVIVEFQVVAPPLWKLSSIGGTMLYTFLRRSFRVAAAMLIYVETVVDGFQRFSIGFEGMRIWLKVERSFADQRFWSWSSEVGQTSS
jgi:hypothetical protein